MTLRRRLLLVSLATLAVGVGALLVVGNVLLDRTVRGVTTQLLASRADAQLAALTVSRRGVRVDRSPGAAQLDGRAWVISRGRVIARPRDVSAAVDRAAVALGRRGRPGQGSAASDLRLLARPLVAPGVSRPVGAIVVAVGDAPFDALERKILWGSLAVTVLILVAGGFAIHRALRGALGPVHEMTTAAREWGAHDLDRRFGLGAPRDELTGLAATLDGLLERIAASRRHEQRFAGDVAHELRTPLSVIRGRVDLALDARTPAAPAELTAALAGVGAQAEQMSATVESLLTVARRELDPQSEGVDLVAVVRGFPGVEVRGPRAMPVVEGDPEIIRRALAPLIDNAVRHGHGRVWVELGHGPHRAWATVCDEGRGFDPGSDGAGHGQSGGVVPAEPHAVGRDVGLEEPDGAERDGSPGAGDGARLGLALAGRLAGACGGEVRIDPGPGGRVTLELPARTDDA